MFSLNRSLRSGVFLFIFLSICGVSGYGEGAPVDFAAIESRDNEGVSRAPVLLDGKKLFDVIGVPSYTAEQRAEDIHNRLVAIAGDLSVSTDTLKIVPDQGYSHLMAGDRLVLRVFDADSGIAGVTNLTHAEIVKKRIAEGLLEFRRDRRPIKLLKNVLSAGISGLICVALIFIWLRGFNLIEQFAERTLKQRIVDLQSKSFDIIRAGIVWDGLHGVFKFLRYAPVFLTVYFYFGFSFRLFPWTRAFANNFLGLVFTPLHMLGNAFVRSIPDLLIVLVIAGLTFVALRMTGLFFSGINNGTIKIAGFDQEWAMPTFRIVRLLVIALAVVVAYPHIPGSNSLAFKGVSVFLGVILSMGSSSFASNLIAGYSVIYRRAFRVGDWIKVDGVLGEVLEILPLVTRLRSIKNEVEVIPNSTIINSPVTNFSTLARERGLILHTTVGIGYETPWRQVEAMLMEAADRTSGALKTPKPFVVIKSLDDFAVTFEINVYCDVPQNRLTIYTRLHQNVLDVFNENAVQIMTPAYEGDPATPKVVPNEQWFPPLAKANKGITEPSQG